MTNTKPEEWTVFCRNLYTDPEAMREWLRSGPTAFDRLQRARHCYDVALRPQGRFGLVTCPDSVVRECESAISDIRTEIQPLVEHVVSERWRGMAWDEIWGQLPDELAKFGFTHGGSRLLGLI